MAAMERPDFNTINRFRSEYFEECLPPVFVALVQFLLEEGYIKGSDYFLDGTKLEADCSKFSYVWKKNVVRYKEKVQVRVKEILKEVERVNKEEDDLYGSLDLPEVGEHSKLTSADIRKASQELTRVSEFSGEKEGKKELKKAIQRLEKEKEKLKKYEEQEKVLGERNSYSKTDTDATFMYLKNEELRAAYNVQVGTENGYVAGFSMSQNANDGVTFVDHMSQRKTLGLFKPNRVITDSIYGTEENYDYLEKEEIEGYVKYPSWYREQKGEIGLYDKSRFQYDAQEDSFICPKGRRLQFIEEREHPGASGYMRIGRRYECESCEGCEAKSQCAKTPGNRSVEYRPLFTQYQEQARERLSSEEGIKLRKRRGPEVETVFADIKHNRKYRRIRLRGIKKALIEMFWVFLSYNLIRFGKVRNLLKENLIAQDAMIQMT